MPSSHSLVEIVRGDRRMEISETVESDGVIISSASWILICFLNTDIGNPKYSVAWYYEAGAIAHNIFLESTSLNLKTNVVHNIIDDDALRSALGLSSHNNLVPLLLISTGRTTPSNPPDTPDLSGPTDGKAGKEYTYSVVTTDPDGDQISYLFDWGDGTNSGWTDFVDSEIQVAASHIWSRGEYMIKVKARDIHGTESNWATFKISMPKNRVINTTFQNFLQKNPHWFLKLQQLLLLLSP
jgi:hypothetical protein